MPRGGTDASWLDRRLQTDRLEFLDRDDVSERRKRSVIRALERRGERVGLLDRFAELALEQIAGIPSPKVLELGSGHGALSRRILALHPTAQVTVTDVDATLIGNIAAGDLGSHPRTTVKTEDATSIDATDGQFDLAVFAQSIHHLPPSAASEVFGEGTRVARKLLIIDLHRLPSAVAVVFLPLFVPYVALVAGLPMAHDAFISLLRAYSPSAFRVLAHAADPAIELSLWTERDHQVVVAHNPTAGSPPSDR
jgi:SAM-dependent methyltransferase